MKNKKFMITLLVVVFVGCFAFLGSCHALSEPRDVQLLEISEKELKSCVKYPLTFEFMEFNVNRSRFDDSAYIDCSGSFKSANAFNVYQSHSFKIIFVYYYDNDNLLLTLTEIDDECYRTQSIKC